jgi:hypothetical protein
VALKSVVRIGLPIHTQVRIDRGSIGVEIVPDLGADAARAPGGLIIVPTYTIGTTILGTVPSFSMAFMPGYSVASANVGVGPLSTSGSDSIWGGSDLYPTAQLFWDRGVNNFMAYLTGDIPVGNYNPNRPANIGLGHGAVDAGGAYTYLNTKSGTEFSATVGFTGNFENPSTNYTNGVDSHLDLAASQFLNQQLFVGAVAYVYQQLTPDRGQRALLGPNESRYYLEGAAEMAVYLGRGHTVTEHFVTGDIGYVPVGAGHYIRNTGSGILRLVIAFNTGHYHAQDQRLASLESARCAGYRSWPATKRRGSAF